MSKSSKSERKEDRIQSLEREITNLRKKNVEFQQQKTVRLNDEQLQGFLDELSQQIAWATNRIVDETPKTTIVHSQSEQNDNVLSIFMKWIVAIPFFVAAIVIACSLYNIWGELWGTGWSN